MYQYSSTPTPIGTIYVICHEDYLVKIEFDNEFLQKDQEGNLYNYTPNDPLCESAISQLQEYFAGKRSEFELPIQMEGTTFQKEVWKALSNIQYGEVKCYQDIAKEINRPLAVRAIGQANRRNPLPIVIPCHRVIGKNKELVGYAGDKIGMKEELLKLEGVLV
ncbi:methylated-DNA--[protein]-cysteine S-methyltransferase [Sutcliffiella horikoshii]|uniref:methylated-DNA--[protein]-cysteine S-methyltransferase n=1 Tax=Sutcliffiella horikoshii TaxID=79883 RepID=UPI003CEEB836